MGATDTQTNMLPGKPDSAMCVQNLDDSRGIAIRTTYRISLRSSSLWEPRHPLLKVVRQYKIHIHKTATTLTRPMEKFSFPTIAVFTWYRHASIHLHYHRDTGKKDACNNPPALGLRAQTRKLLQMPKKGLTEQSNMARKKILDLGVVMILPQVHLRKPCYDFTFL